MVINLLISDLQKKLVMQTPDKITNKEFQAVECMRQVRSELTEKYLQNKNQYLKDLKKSMEDFKCRQAKNKLAN